MGLGCCKIRKFKIALNGWAFEKAETVLRYGPLFDLPAWLGPFPGQNRILVI
jgi:hypothetical protein